MNKGKKWHEEHREIIDVIQLINVTGPSIHKESYDWLIKLYDEWKDLKQQLEKERERKYDLLTDFYEWNAKNYLLNHTNWGKERVLKYLELKLTQNQSKDG